MGDAQARHHDRNLEMCDLVAVNKADGELLEASKRTRLDYERGLPLLRPREQLPVLAVSALEKTGLEELWQSVGELRATVLSSGHLEERRAEQAERWLWRIVEDELMRGFREHPEVKRRFAAASDEVRAGKTSPAAAARALLEAARRPVH